MKVGFGAMFQGDRNTMSDHEVWETDLAMADQAEPSGFDSVWATEHHFTRYHMSPDPLQFVTYMAGRTSRVQLGTMVTVLPWRHPVRVTENIIVADHLSKGRVLLGIGRGTGPVEFDGIGVPMDTARERFKEISDVVIQGLETGVMEYDGEIIKQPRVTLHPEPYQSFRDRIWGASVSPESAELMAGVGAGVLIIPQKPWKVVAQEMASYREMYAQYNNAPLPPSVVAGWTFVDESEDRARELAHKYIGDYFHAVVDHYGFNRPMLKDTKGYESHAVMYERLSQPGGLEKMTKGYVDLKPYGTPEQVYEKIKGFSTLVGADHFVGVFRYSGMSAAEGNRNMRLFAKEVLPELKKLDIKVSAEPAMA
jgi:alkanesulfonate monooxygenase SsuD/methylene tetrahydromethanopterin reductase-like flavin-dependent oxidoreductase (luciferase family)